MTSVAGMKVRFDFFWYAENNRVHPRSRPAKSLTLDLPVDTGVETALAAARAAGMPKGSARCRCFEIQTDEGIWACEDGQRLDRATKPPTFLSWEQLDAAEETSSR